MFHARTHSDTKSLFCEDPKTRRKEISALKAPSQKWGSRLCNLKQEGSPVSTTCYLLSIFWSNLGNTWKHSRLFFCLVPFVALDKQSIGASQVDEEEIVRCYHLRTRLQTYCSNCSILFVSKGPNLIESSWSCKKQAHYACITADNEQAMMAGGVSTL